jgi:hypothetical protein
VIAATEPRLAALGHSLTGVLHAYCRGKPRDPNYIFWALRAAARGKRIVGPATQQRIRATLRSAVTSYMPQHPGILPANRCPAGTTAR